MRPGGLQPTGVHTERTQRASKPTGDLQAPQTCSLEQLYVLLLRSWLWPQETIFRLSLSLCQAVGGCSLAGLCGQRRHPIPPTLAADAVFTGLHQLHLTPTGHRDTCGVPTRQVHTHQDWHVSRKTTEGSEEGLISNKLLEVAKPGTAFASCVTWLGPGPLCASVPHELQARTPPLGVVAQGNSGRW